VRVMSEEMVVQKLVETPDEQTVFVRAMHACALVVYRQRWNEAFEIAQRLAANVSLPAKDPAFSEGGVRGRCWVEGIRVEVTVLAPLLGVDQSLLFAVTVEDGAHGAAPICAKAGGPVVDGKPQGITQGVNYIRKPGPASEAILTAAEWAPVIRRCAMHDRSAILSAVDAALRGSGTPSASAESNLKIWHSAAHAVFVKDASQGRAPATLANGHFQFSYGIERSNEQRLPTGELIEILRQVNAEVRDLVATSWSMFHIFTSRGIAPVFVEDPASGQGENDFVECAQLRDPRPGSGAAEMWRVSSDGKATIIRGYLEDDGASIGL
jgi:hypothetical protein